MTQVAANTLETQGVTTEDLGTVRTPDLNHQFDKDGVVSIRQFLNKDEVTELSMHAAPHFARASTAGKFAGILKNLDKHDSWFAEYFGEGAIKGFVEDLVGRELTVASVGCFVRWPNRPDDGVHPHRDQPHSQVFTGATIWIAIDSTTLENGAVNYLMGSHRYEVNLKDPQRVLLDEENTFSAFLAPGDAAVHNANTVHWSGPNLTSAPRRGITCFYFDKARVSQKPNTYDK